MFWLKFDDFNSVLTISINVIVVKVFFFYYFTELKQKNTGLAHGDI